MLKKLFLSFISGLFIISNAYAGYLLNPFTGNQDAVPTVEEEDGSPSVYAPSKIKVTNGSLTDNGDGSVSIVTGGGGGGTGDVTDVGDCTGGACFTGSSGNTLTFKGATSGTIALKPAAVAGTNTITLPAETGTIITSATNLAGDVTGTPGATVVGDDSHSHTSATLPANTTYLGSTIEKEEISDATSTPTASKIPIADASGKLDNWITLGSSIEDAEIPSSITRDTEWDTWAEHPALTSGYILVGNASNQAAAVAMSGDATISNTGVVTVADDSHSHTSSTLPANTSYLGSSIEEAELNFSDVTTNNASTTKHGLLPKLSNNSSQYLNGTGNWSTPAGGGSTPGGSVNQLQYNYPSGTFGGTPLIVTDGSNLSVGIGTTGNASRLYIKGAGTTTGFALRIANSQATDRLVVLDNGNVGIGLTSPYGLLQVGTAPTNPGLIVTTSNNVGIGTTNPNYTLHVAGTAASQTLRFGTNLDNILPAGTGANGQVLQTDGTGAISWATPSAGGTPGGSDTYVQFNDGGSFGGNSNFIFNKTSGNVGIGIASTSPSERLEVSGNIKLSGVIKQGSLGDVAEMIPVSKCIFNTIQTILKNPPILSNEALRYPEPGDVVVIDEDGGIRLSHEPFATNVVGIVSTTPAQVLRDGLDNAVPVALNGIVPCKATAENGAIKPGDLLVASTKPGYAMKAGKNPPVGAVIGKAMGKLEKGKGIVKVLVMLR